VIQLYSMLWLSALFFGFIGVLRGLRREVISLAGIILATFALYQFDSFLRGIFLATVPRDQAFFVQICLFGGIVYFAYQTRSLSAPRAGAGPRGNRLQDAVLGGLLGAVNGYLIWGAVWYFLDINDYPFAPLIIAPDPNSISAQYVGTIPLALLGGAAGGSTDLLTILVIIIFMSVLFVM
jgi:colicin V production protein